MSDNKFKVTNGFIPDNCIDNVVGISDMSITYTQLPDTNSTSDEYQYITFTAENNGCGEDGWYISIKTDTKWSINNPEDISNLVNDFMTRMNFHTTKESELKTIEVDTSK